MGVMAEMMLDGTLCEQCGVFIGPPVGHTRLCEECQQDDDYDFNELLNIINVATEQIIENGTHRQKKALTNKLYSKLHKLKKGMN